MTESSGFAFVVAVGDIGKPCHEKKCVLLDLTSTVVKGSYNVALCCGCGSL